MLTFALRTNMVYKIKPLDWIARNYDAIDRGHYYTAKGVPTRCYIIVPTENFRWDVIVSEDYRVHVDTYTTLEGAMAFCQRDHEQRMQGFLQPDPHGATIEFMCKCFDAYFNQPPEYGEERNGYRPPIFRPGWDMTFEEFLRAKLLQNRRG